jgi:DtxR family Mn-dependent transcriptional regulator
MAGKAKDALKLVTEANDEPSNKMLAYLARIYRLLDIHQLGEGYLRTALLAETLDVTAPAVNRMINRLKEQGLLEHEPYQGIRLTDTGRREALHQLRAQRIAECFLVQVMHMDWTLVHAEAERMALALSEALIDRMNEMAGFPHTCPHGEPIPNAEGNIEALDDCWLSQVSAGTHVQVTRLRTREVDRLKYIEALGLTPQAQFEVLHVAPFNGPLQLKLGHEYRIVGSNLAELIRVHVQT